MVQIGFTAFGLRYTLEAAGPRTSERGQGWMGKDTRFETISARDSLSLSAART